MARDEEMGGSLGRGAPIGPLGARAARAETEGRAAGRDGAQPSENPYPKRDMPAMRAKWEFGRAAGARARATALAPPRPMARTHADHVAEADARAEADRDLRDAARERGKDS